MENRCFNAQNDMKAIITEVKSLIKLINPEFLENVKRAMPKTFEQINNIDRERRMDEKKTIITTYKILIHLHKITFLTRIKAA